MNAVTCLPCELELADDDAIIYRDDDWSCEVAVGWDVPGWFILRTRRHAEWWSGPDAAEIAAFGPLAQRVAIAITTATAARTTYFLSFGENYPHFHFLLAARPNDLETEFRGAGIMRMRDTHRDPVGARAVAADVRAGLAGIDEVIRP